MSNLDLMTQCANSKMPTLYRAAYEQELVCKGLAKLAYKDILCMSLAKAEKLKLSNRKSAISFQQLAGENSRKT